MDESRYNPTREAVFTETMQIGIVVRDLDATLRRYVDDFGIGPWQVHEFDPQSAEDMREHGQPVERSGRGALTRFATTMIGGVMWELIEPLEEDSLWGRFLAEKGEGVHHIALATPGFEGAVAEQAERGNDLVLSGTFSGIDIAYLPTDRDLGVITEIFSGMSGAEREPNT